MNKTKKEEKKETIIKKNKFYKRWKEYCEIKKDNNEKI